MFTAIKSFNTACAVLYPFEFWLLQQVTIILEFQIYYLH